MSDEIHEDEVRGRFDAAYAEVVRLCSGRDRGQWRMSVPANVARDSDLLITAALDDIPKLLDRIEELEVELYRATKDPDAPDEPLHIAFPEVKVLRGGVKFR